MSGHGAREVVVARPGDPLGGRLRELAGVLEGRDRAMGCAARLLVAVSDADGLHDRLGGMTLQVWLEHVCRIPGSDARALLGAVDVLARMPALLAGLCDGWLSLLQVTAICRAARKVRVALLADLDMLVGDAMVGMARFEPDALVDDVWGWVDANQPSRLEREQAALDRGEWLHLQPMLTGGGTFNGQYGAAHFAILAEATTPTAPPSSPLAGHDPEELDQLDADAVDDLYATLDDRSRAHTRDHGAAMAARLVELCADSLAATSSHDTAAAADGGGRPARPLLLATVDLDALLDQTRTPGWLLHTLAGGRMKITATALQALVDQRGADLRGIVFDDHGEVIGVGRRTHVPPGWLRQAIWARDLTVRDPDGTCPVRRADLDHIVPYGVAQQLPGTRSVPPVGATNVTNLMPLGRRWHNHKTTRAWTITRQPDGTTSWHHRRHDWTLRLAPPRRTFDTPPPTGPPPTGPRAGPDTSTPAQPCLTGVP